MTDAILTTAAAAVNVPFREWAELSTGVLSFSSLWLEACKTNACGSFGKSWACPPGCGTMEEQREKIMTWESVFVFTTVHKLEDSFDYEGMLTGRELHTKLTIEVKKLSGSAPVYGAGTCPVCNNKDGNSGCSYPNTCLYPEKKIGSIEAAGIDVSELSRAAGIAYNNGTDTVTFFTIILKGKIVTIKGL